MSRIIILATHGSRLDRAVSLVLQSAAAPLGRAGVLVSASGATCADVLAAVGGHPCATHVVLVDALDFADDVAGLDGTRAQLVERGSTLELHGLVLPIFEQALDIWSESIAEGAAVRDFTSWLADESRIAWPRLLRGAEMTGGGLWPVHPSACPIEWLVRLLDAPPVLASGIRAIAEEVLPSLPRRLAGWELELCRLLNVEGRPAAGRVLRLMSPTGPPYRATEEDIAVLLSRFASLVDTLNGGQLRGGGRAQLASLEMLADVGRIRPPAHEHSVTPPTLHELDKGDRMTRAVLALLIVGGN